MKGWLKFFLLLLLVIFIYRDSFASRFFQDDKLNIELAASRNFLAVIPGANHFRPVSVQGFYTLGELVSAGNPLGYHLLGFVIFAATLVLVYKTAFFFTGNPGQSSIITLLYATNISLFANFFWIANSQFIIGGFLFFLTFLLFYHKRFFPLAIPVFLIGLASNEQILMLILVLPVISFFWKKPFAKNAFIVLCALGIIWVGLRTLLFKLPVNPDYTISLNPIVAVQTFRWYILRALNLPEGIKLTADRLFTGVWILFLFSLIRRKVNWKLILTGVFWFIVTLGIFIFLPKHMSAHYLTVALFGGSLIISELLPKRNMLFAVALVFYLFLTIRGLDFLSRTHWIILKNTGPIGQF